jgi:hypothetical protein
MSYRIVYSLADQGSPWPFAAAAAACATGAVLSFVFSSRTPFMLASGVLRMRSGIFFGIWLSGVTLFVIAFGGSAYADYQSVTLAVREGQEQVVEGRVDTFGAAGINNHRDVRLTVTGAEFSWNESAFGHYGYSGPNLSAVLLVTVLLNILR